MRSALSSRIAKLEQILEKESRPLLSLSQLLRMSAGKLPMPEEVRRQLTREGCAASLDEPTRPGDTLQVIRRAAARHHQKEPK
jgi:hypothetical protein